MLSPLQQKQSQSFSITQATTPQEITYIKCLFHEYTSSLNMDLSFQNYATEVAGLPGKYAPSEGGCLLLAKSPPTLSTSSSYSPNIFNSAKSASGKESEGEENEEKEKVIGCIALRALPSSSPSPSLPHSSLSPSPFPSSPQNPSSSQDEQTCELKRLYVIPSSRSTGLGALLIQRAIQEAKNLGYTTIKLDTLPHMIGAIKLYERFGFRRMKEAYYDTPVQGTVFMEMRI